MKMLPVYGPTKISYVDQGGYYEQNWVTCSNCKVASAEYKKICPSCKGMGGKRVQGKFIPKTKRKLETKEELGWNGDNLSGFSGLPGGYRGYFANFYLVGSYGIWWSVSEPYESDAWFRDLNNTNSDMRRGNHSKGDGISVRCLKDNNNSSSGLGGGSGNGSLYNGGPSYGKNRVPLNNPLLPLYKTEVDIYVHLKLIIDEDGKVVSAINLASKTTTTDKLIINGVISEVINQLKYNQEKNAGLQFTYLTCKIRAQ
jgi:hypothetical protein